MELEYGEEYEAFRQEIRTFLETHKPKGGDRTPSDLSRQKVNAWLALQIERGYWARTIPKEYGG